MNVPAIIDTERLIVRRHTIEDLEAFARFLADGEATRYMAFTPEQRTREGAKLMLDYVIAAYDTPDAVFSMTIADPDTDTYWGSCGLNPLPEEPEAIEMYYTVMPDRQGNGYATEAARAIVEYAFAHSEYQRIIAHVMEENVASIRVAQHLGFQDDGPVDRQAETGDLSHAQLSGRRYVLER